MVNTHDCVYKQIKGTEYRSEYEPEHVSWQEACSICGEIRFASGRRPAPKCELVVDNANKKNCSNEESAKQKILKKALLLDW